MKHEDATLRTKKRLAASLRKRMEKKPLSKITVSEIVADCDVNRKTFYYHFVDVYDLLKWMLEQEAVEVVRQFDLLTEYPDAISFVIDYVENNRHILNCAYDSMGRDEMKRFFYNDFIDVLSGAVGRAERELALEVDEDFKAFLAEFFTEALVGSLISLFREKGVVDREAILSNVALICRVSIPDILRAKAREQAGTE